MRREKKRKAGASPEGEGHRERLSGGDSIWSAAEPPVVTRKRKARKNLPVKLCALKAHSDM